MTDRSRLDVIAIGRSSVDLYGQQIGGRLEDMATFAKSVGGCPANIAIGCARLGLRSALVTRVGDEHMGRFVREQLDREGVETSAVLTDPDRLTALVILGVRAESAFPLIFYRTNCADMALCEDDIDADFISRADAVVVTGTHFSTPQVAAASRKVMRLARANRARVVFDVDYRPTLWGLAGHGEGEARFIASGTVTEHLQGIVGDCDLIVGTEEELHIAGGSEDTIEAIRRIRALSDAVIVCKRGPMGCSTFAGDVPDSLNGGIIGPGYPVEVFNVLGAGDAFMSGFLRGWLRGESLETCCGWANACGAFAVSRLLCSTEIPTWPELQEFLEKGSTHRALRKDAHLNHLHWATTRRPQPETLMTLAIDHRRHFEELAEITNAAPERIGEFKLLAVRAVSKVAGGKSGYGMLLDGRHGTRALHEAAGQGLWIGRPIELPGSRPLEFEEGADLGSHLTEWPLAQTVKCLCNYRLDDPEPLREAQDAALLRLYDACRTIGRELSLAIVTDQGPGQERDTVARVISHFYDLGIRPDWWKLEAQPDAAAWSAIENAILRTDAFCRGIVVLGAGAGEERLVGAMALAAETQSVRGFAIGRTIFSQAARLWLAGEINDADAVDDMATRFRRLAQIWRETRTAAGAGKM